MLLAIAIVTGVLGLLCLLVGGLCRVAGRYDRQMEALRAYPQVPLAWPEVDMRTERDRNDALWAGHR